MFDIKRAAWSGISSDKFLGPLGKSPLRIFGSEELSVELDLAVESDRSRILKDDKRQDFGESEVEVEVLLLFLPRAATNLFFCPSLVAIVDDSFVDFKGSLFNESIPT